MATAVNLGLHPEIVTPPPLVDEPCIYPAVILNPLITVLLSTAESEEKEMTLVRLLPLILVLLE